MAVDVLHQLVLGWMTEKTVQPVISAHLWHVFRKTIADRRAMDGVEDIDEKRAWITVPVIEWYRSTIFLLRWHKPFNEQGI